MIKPHSTAPLGLRTIALFEAAKGALALAAAAGLLSLRDTDLHAAADAFLLRHGFNPEHHYTRMVIESAAKASQQHHSQIVGFALVYACVRLVEGYGLWHARSWAEWFAALSAGLYLPFELIHFARHPHFFIASIILLNLLLVIYLARLIHQQRRLRHAEASARAAQLRENSPPPARPA